MIDQGRQVNDPGLTRNRMHHMWIGSVREHGHDPTRCQIGSG
jgi:hypothetical protein